MLRLPVDQHQVILDACRAALPNEAGGLLIGTGEQVARAVPCRNVDHSPHRYTLDPADLLAAIRGAQADLLDVIGVWHSHPGGTCRPSVTDVREAIDDELVYLIVGTGHAEGTLTVQAWRLLPHVVEVQVVFC